MQANIIYNLSGVYYDAIMNSIPGYCWNDSDIDDYIMACLGCAI